MMQNQTETNKVKGERGRKGMEKGGLESRINIEYVWPSEQKYRRWFKPCGTIGAFVLIKALILGMFGASTAWNASSNKVLLNRKSDN